MKKSSALVLVLSVISILWLAFIPDNAFAIPAFARKYQTSCVLCHAPFPRLTAMGEAFRLNGYKIPQADEIYVKDQPVSLGAEPYKKVFPEAVWPSNIPGQLPLSIRAVGDVKYHPNGSQSNRSEFNLPTEVDVLGAGAFGNDFSFFVNIGFQNQDDNTTTSTKAWLMWQNLFPGIFGENHFNIKAGTVGSQEIALPNTRNENSYTIEDYLYVTKLGLDSHPGFEINGFGRQWRYALGLVETDSSNSQKDPYAAFAFKFGGLGFDGMGGKSEAGGLSVAPSGYWRDDSVILGLFAFRTYVGANADTFDRIGGDIRLNHNDFSLSGGFIRGVDNSVNQTQNIWFAEAEYFLFPWMVLNCRYEDLFVQDADMQDQTRFVFGTSMLIRANIRANLECRLYTKNEPIKLAGGDIQDDDQIALRLDFAF